MEEPQNVTTKPAEKNEDDGKKGNDEGAPYHTYDRVDRPPFSLLSLGNPN